MPHRTRVHVDEIQGDAVFVLASHEPDIPEGAGRDCPQCKRIAWGKSRFCWHCDFDFDRAAIPKIHPTKVVWVAMFLNAVLALAAGFHVAASFLTGRGL